MSDSDENKFGLIHVGPNVFNAAKNLAAETNKSQHEALTDLTIDYLQNKYSKEMEEDPNFVTAESLVDGTAGLFDIIPEYEGVSIPDRRMSYRNIIHTLTDYKEPDTSDFFEVGARELTKGAASGAGFAKATAATGSAIIPALTATAGLPGFLLGGALSIGAGLLGGALTYSAADTILDTTFGDDPEVLTGTSGKNLTEGIRSFAGAFGGSLPLAFSKKISNLGANSLAKGLSKKALDTTDDAINAMTRFAKENKGTFALSEAIASAPIGTAGAAATSIGYDQGWERLGFEVLGGFTGGAAAASFLKLLPAGVKGAVDLGATTKGALSKGTDSLNDVNSTIAGLEGVPPEQIIFMKRAQEYMNEYGLEQEGDAIAQAIAQGVLYSEELQKAVREVAEAKPDLFSASELTFLEKGGLTPTLGQAAPEGFVANLQAVLSNKDKNLRNDELGYENFLNTVTGKYIENLKNSGDETKVSDALKFNEAFLEGQFEEAYRKHAERFVEAQDRVFGKLDNIPVEQRPTKASTSTALYKHMENLEKKIKSRENYLYENLDLDRTVYNSRNVKELEDGKPAYIKIFDDEIMQGKSPDFLSGFLQSHKTIFDVIEAHKTALGLPKSGFSPLSSKSSKLYKKTFKKIYDKYSQLKGFTDYQAAQGVQDFLEILNSSKYSPSEKQALFTKQFQKYDNMIKEMEPRKPKNKKDRAAHDKKLKAYQSLKSTNDFAAKKMGTLETTARQVSDAGVSLGDTVTFKQLDGLRKEILGKLRKGEVVGHDAILLNKLANEDGLLKDLNDFSNKMAVKEGDSSYSDVISFVKTHHDILGDISLKGIFGKGSLPKGQRDELGRREALFFRNLFKYDEKKLDATAISYENLRKFARFADEMGLAPEANQVELMDSLVSTALVNHLDQYGIKRSTIPTRTSFSESMQSDPLIKMDEFKKQDLSKIKNILEEFSDKFKNENIPNLVELKADFKELEDAGTALEVFFTKHNKNLEDEILLKWIHGKTDGTSSLINILRDSYKNPDLSKLDKFLGLGKIIDDEDKADFKKGMLKLILEYATTGSTASVSPNQNVFDAHQFYDILFGKLNENVKDSLMDRVYANGIINDTELARIKSAAILKRNAADFMAKTRDSNLSDPSGLTDDTVANQFLKSLANLLGLKGASTLSKTAGFGASSLHVASKASRFTEYIVDKLPSQLKDDLRNQIFLDPILYNKLYKMSKAASMEELQKADISFGQAMLQSLKKNDYSAELLGNLLIAPLMKYKGPVSRTLSEEYEGPTEEAVRSILAELRRSPALKDYDPEEVEVSEDIPERSQPVEDSLSSRFSFSPSFSRTAQAVGELAGNISLPDFRVGQNAMNTVRRGNPAMAQFSQRRPIQTRPTNTESRATNTGIGQLFQFKGTNPKQGVGEVDMDEFEELMPGFLAP